MGLAELIALKPSVLILDEPTANLDYESCIELGKLIVELKNLGISIIIADHRLFWLKDIVDKIFIMDNGEIIKNITKEEILKLNNDLEVDTLLQKIYGLRNFNFKDVRGELPDAQETLNPILEIKDLSFSYKGGEKIFDKLSLKMAPGIVGLIGRNGLGKTTLCRILFHLEKYQSGEIFIGGEKINKKNALKKLSLVLQNADYQLNMKTVKSEIEICLKFAHKTYDENLIDVS